MVFALIVLLGVALLDMAIMIGISRIPSLDSFTLVECVGVPLALFFIAGSALRAAGFAAPPWPAFAVSYTIAAVALFLVISTRKHGFQNWGSYAKRSVLSALLFCALHFAVQATAAVAIGD